MTGVADTKSRFSRPVRRTLTAVLTAAAGLLTAAAQNSASAEDTTLKYMTWAGYEEPAFIQPFIEKYGLPEYILYAHPDEAFLKVQSGFEADVLHPCMNDIAKWQKAGLLKPIDPAKIVWWDDLLPSLRDAPGVVIDGEHWILPWEWGYSSVLYRTDKVTLTEESYSALVDPAYKGRVSVPDSFDEVYVMVALVAGVEDPLNLKEEDYEKIEATFRQLNGNLRFIWSDPSALEQALAAGEIDLAWGWPNSYVNLKNGGTPIAWMTKPKEGVAAWLCGPAILASATAPEEEIYDFLNTLASPESGKTLIETFGYAQSNKKALEMVGEAKMQELGMTSNPEDFLSDAHMIGGMDPDQRARLVEMWETIRAGG